MQNAPLPSLITAKAGNAAHLNKPAARPDADGNPGFRQALAQQLEQRQNAAAPARATPVKPAVAAKPAQPSQADVGDQAPAPATASRPASSDDASAAESAVHAPDGASDAAAIDAKADADAARSADPVADMLALVAAFNLPAAAAGNAPAPAIDAARQASASSTGSTGSTAGASVPAADSATDAAALAAANAAVNARDGGLADSAAVAGASDGGEADAGRSNAADFKAALARAATADAAAPGMDAADATQPAHKMMPMLAALAGQDSPRTPIDGVGNAGASAAAATVHSAAPTTASKALTTGADAAATGALADADAAAASAATPRAESTINIKAQAGDFSQQLGASRERQAEAIDEAALLTKDSTPAPVAAGAGAVPDAAKAATLAPTDKLYSRVGTPAWDQQLGQKVIFMAAGGEHSATMELNPPDLGPLQVVLSVNKDQATAAFTSAAPEVRQALEAALPRLREMMGEAGIALGNATVSAGADQNPGQRAAANDGQAQRGRSDRHDNSADSVAAAAATTTGAARLPNGVVDTFA